MIIIIIIIMQLLLLIVSVREKCVHNTLARFIPLSLYLLLRVVQIAEHLILIAEDVVVNVVLLWVLRGKHERLHEAAEGPTVVGELPGHLHYYSIAYSRLTVHLTDLGVALIEVQHYDLLVDLLQKVKQ